MYGTEHAINLNLKTWKYMKDLLDDIKRRMDVSKLIYDRENRTEGHLRLKNENYGKYIAYSHCYRQLKKIKTMSKLNNKKYVLYSLSVLVILWALTYVCFSFVLLDFNVFNWTQATRGGFVFVTMLLLALIVPVTQLIKD